MKKVLDFPNNKEVGTNANRYNFHSDSLSATCFYDDKYQGYVLIIDDGTGRVLFTNFSKIERLTIHELRKVFAIYGFSIKERVYAEIEKESSRKQRSAKYEYEVGSIDSFEFG